MNVDKEAVVWVVLGQPWAGRGKSGPRCCESHLETRSVGVKSRLLYNQRASLAREERAVQVMLG